jgi:hypothetical protein
VVAKGGVAARQRQDGPGAARAQGLTDRRGGLQATLDAAQADTQTSGTAESVECALVDEGIDARSADAEKARCLRRGQTLIDELV